MVVMGLKMAKNIPKIDYVGNFLPFLDLLQPNFYFVEEVLSFDLVGHMWKLVKNWFEIFAGKFLGKSFLKILWEILAEKSCGKLLREILVGKSCGKILLENLVGNSCGKILWEMLQENIHS